MVNTIASSSCILHISLEIGVRVAELYIDDLVRNFSFTTVQHRPQRKCHSKPNVQDTAGSEHGIYGQIYAQIVRDCA